MEEDAKQFLLRVARSITVSLLWLFINMTLGIYIGLLLFEDYPSTANIVFYIWFILSLAFLIRFLIRTWWPREKVSTAAPDDPPGQKSL
ncbi:MAG: hypothetical protein EOO04_27630 [Chitinophagaceae bacterium]|nr:MAG: hypothetical protein EOO04_27630 [Chitinophagaceae bacterium]